ncbi:N(6)-adenosine-methyltransferase catalytic subunit METTL3 isoform X2 [Taeniopygia guttata]|uniref:N(6)-adenosine-methyltransferase catalytic subunit METTL3 isoform X2 n=1 Tax=Taeniopygia guttata TaxID=59729 RepID=UPI003BB8BE61
MPRPGGRGLARPRPRLRPLPLRGSRGGPGGAPGAGPGAGAAPPAAPVRPGHAPARRRRRHPRGHRRGRRSGDAAGCGEPPAQIRGAGTHRAAPGAAARRPRPRHLRRPLQTGRHGGGGGGIGASARGGTGCRRRRGREGGGQAVPEDGGVGGVGRGSGDREPAESAVHQGAAEQEGEPGDPGAAEHHDGQGAVHRGEVPVAGPRAGAGVLRPRHHRGVRQGLGRGAALPPPALPPHHQQAHGRVPGRLFLPQHLFPHGHLQWICCDIRYLDVSILGKFAVVMADPPWDIHMELPYGTLTDDEMRRLNIPVLQDEGFLFLWVTGRAMELGRECLNLWGYERVDEIIWVKTNQLQRIIRTGRTGHWLNHGKEHCLVGVKGNPQGFNRGLDCDVIVAEVRSTSHKPDEIYGMIERLSPGTRKIELFGRPHNVQPNWITLGNQLDGIHLLDPDVVARFKQHYPDGVIAKPKNL